MKPISYSISLATAGSANGIAASQSVVGATAVIINGALATAGVATLPQTRRVLITSAGNDTGITFAITGTDWNGHTITETVTGANTTTAQSSWDYTTVTSIVTSGSTAAAITVGTNAVGSSPPIRFDYYGLPQVALQVDVTGTINYTVQSTVDNLNDTTLGGVAGPYTWVNSSDTNVVSATTTVQSNFAYLPSACRVLVNSGVGTAKITVIQAGPGVLH